MKLIKQLNEVAKTAMSQDVFNRLVQYVVDVLHDQSELSGTDDDILEVTYSAIEDVAGYEETKDAAKLAKKVFKAVKSRLGDD